MIRYKKYQVTGEDSPLKGLWYARPVIEETFDIEKLAKHMSNHNTPYSSGVFRRCGSDRNDSRCRGSRGGGCGRGGNPQSPGPRLEAWLSNEQ